MSGNGHGRAGSTHADPLDAYMDRVKAMVEVHGWMAQAVFPTAEHPEGKYFVYTVGLHAKGHPEFIIAGLDQESAHSVLVALAVRVLGGETFEEQVYDDVLQGGYKVQLRWLPRTAVDEYLSVAQRHAQADVEAFQVLWPDPDGKLPPACATDHALVQDLGTP